MKKQKHDFFVAAIVSLASNSGWNLVGTDYSGLNWLDDSRPKPTEEAILAEAERLEIEWNNSEYQRLRASEYPPMEDYLDAVVKGDVAQQEAYIAACKAVKEKYPKPV